MLSPDAVRSTRQRLGPVGVWLGMLGVGPMEEERQAARRIEEMGYGSLWCGETIIAGKEAFSHQSVLLAATEHMVTGTGVANVWGRAPGTMECGGATLGAAYPGRFILGVGISHAAIVESSGQAYVKPLAHMARYLADMDGVAPNAPRTDMPVPRVLAALRPQMLALARERGDGAHPYFVPPAHTALAREALGADKLLLPEQAIVLETDATEARSIAREHMERYLQLPNYVNNLRHLGYGDEDVSGGGSDRLVDAIVAWGDEDAILRRVAEHRDNGADSVLLQPLGDVGSALTQLDRLAGALGH